MTRALTCAVLLAAMVGFGFGVYQAASLLRSDGTHVVRPTSTTAPAVPGTIYVAQDGALYRLKDGQFTQVTSDAGWTQPAASPDGTQLVAVKRVGDYSDLYLLAASGRVEAQLTHHRSAQIEANHWSFYPRFSPDGKWIFYSYDTRDPYETYRVDLSIFAIAVDGSAVVQWTNPNPYTGGDADPVPLRTGALLYTKYSIDDKSQVHSQVWIAARPGSPGAALTQPDENCGSPAVSPDETVLVMVCRHSQLQETGIVTASLNTATFTIGSETTLVTGRLAASPVFSPDSKTIAFLAPVESGGAFQLWTVAALATGTQPPAPRPLTQNVGLDSTTAPVWER